MKVNCRGEICLTSSENGQKRILTQPSTILWILIGNSTHINNNMESTGACTHCDVLHVLLLPF